MPGIDHSRAAQRDLRSIHRNGKPKGSPIPENRRNSATPELAKAPNILEVFELAIEAWGLVGLGRTAKLLYLALTTRFFDWPIPVVLKGPSSAGKSFAVKQVLKFFPSEAFFVLSSMSGRALAYLEEPLVHRFLVINEAAGLGEVAEYLVRSLLSEGRILHQTVESTKQGLRPKLLDKAGPTGLILTTTAVNLHKENETRLFSVPVADDPNQTRRVLLAQARSSRPDCEALESWRDLQTWLSTQEHRVDLPFAEALAGQIPPIAVRLRRDFPAVLSLIKAHAVLHQASRARSTDGHVIADFSDYAAVRDLVFDLISEGAESTVSTVLRQTVNAVAELREERDPNKRVGVTTVANHLGIDRSSASRRIAVAIERGYLRNLETTKKGKQYDLILDDPLPEDVQILPDVATLQESCSVAAGFEWTPTSEIGDYLEGDL